MSARAEAPTRARWGGVVWRVARGNVSALARALRQSPANARKQMRGRQGPPISFGVWFERIAGSPQTTAIPVLVELEIVMTTRQLRCKPLGELAARFRAIRAELARAAADAEEAEAKGDGDAWDAAQARWQELSYERRAIRRVMVEVHRTDPLDMRP